MKSKLDIALKLNSLLIRPGEILDHNQAKSAGFRKTGPFGKLLLGRERGHIVYHAKNCKMSCFDQEIEIVPNPQEAWPEIPGSDVTGRPVKINWSGDDFKCKTSAYYFLEKDNSIREINFQVLDNALISEEEYNVFIETCSSHCGPPVFWDSEGPRKTPGPGITAAWRGSDSCVYTNLSVDSQHFLIMWLTNLIDDDDILSR